MKWQDGDMKEVGFYFLDCRPYNKNSQSPWVVTAFFRGDSFALFDPRGFIQYPNVEISVDDLVIHRWAGPIVTPIEC